MHPTISQSLAALLASFPAVDSFDPESTARAYAMAVEDIQPQFVAAAVKRFIRGEVAREKHTFLPSTAELAIEARSLEKQADVAARIAARNALPKPQDSPSKPVDTDERARVAEMMESLAKGLGKHAEAKRRVLALPTEAEVKAALADELRGITVSPEALSRLGVETKENAA